MIPRIIHYCWFGDGQISDSTRQCIESWKRFLPDYEIRIWSEENFDVNTVPFVKEAYESRKYAFVSDYVRLYALYHEGGIYFDTDFEVLKNLDCFLEMDFVAGFESLDRVATCILMARENSPLIETMMKLYQERHFLQHGHMDMTTNVELLTGILVNLGLKKTGRRQELTMGQEHLLVCDIKDFCPYSMGDRVEDAYPESFGVHWCQGSWVSGSVKAKHQLIRMLKKGLGDQNYRRILDGIKTIRRKIGSWQES